MTDGAGKSEVPRLHGATKPAAKRQAVDPPCSSPMAKARPQIGPRQRFDENTGRAMTSRQDSQGFRTMSRPIAALASALALLVTAPLAAQDRDWVERSNAYTAQVLEMQAQFQPENASQAGLEKYDGQALDLQPNLAQRYVAAEEAKLGELRAAHARETDPLLKQDLQILIDSLELDIEGTPLTDRLTLAWIDVPRLAFGNLNALLDDQIGPERRATARQLLERYTGLARGSTPLTDLAKAQWAESQGAGKVGPFRASVDDTLGKTDTYIAGIRELFTKYQIEGAAPALDAMERQFREFAAWERATVLPAARPEFRLPPELYA